MADFGAAWDFFPKDRVVHHRRWQQFLPAEPEAQPTRIG
jgi:hypothetical protein